MELTINERAAKWMAGTDKGASSKTIWKVMMGEEPERMSYPSDGSDLGRCLRLLELIPEWKPRMSEMDALSQYWAALVVAWPLLESIHNSGDADAVYAAMTSILRPLEDKDPNIIRLGGGASLRFGR